MACILIVEDNPNNMKLAALLLENAGHEVLRAEDALRGLDLARAHLPDLVLMDIHLPGMDGLTAARVLKADDKTSHIKVIALTAFAMVGDAQKMQDSGCDGYIAKPIRYKQFLQAINTLL